MSTLPISASVRCLPLTHGLVGSIMVVQGALNFWGGLFMIPFTWWVLYMNIDRHLDIDGSHQSRSSMSPSLHWFGFACSVFCSLSRLIFLLRLQFSTF